MEIITKNSQETQKLGQGIGLKLKPKKILALYGDLGAGKTTFLQGLAKGLGVKRRVISPTFVFLKEYPILDGSIFYHLDLYRIENSKDALGLGLKEIFDDPKAIVVIEWADKIEGLLPKKRTDIYFDYLSDQERKITIKEK